MINPQVLTGEVRNPLTGNSRVIFAAGIVSMPLLRTDSQAKPGHADPLLMRPPGSLEEKEFLTRCVKCGECMKVCKTNGL
jgi:ferredoxin